MILNIRPARPGSDGRSYTITHDYSLKQVHLICFDSGVAVGGQIEPFSFADEPLEFYGQEPTRDIALALCRASGILFMESGELPI
jgi:hypothetical protein